MHKRIRVIAMLLFAVLAVNASAQKVAIKTNLLYDATTTMNLGLEFGLAPRWTIDISGNYNPWTFADNKKMKQWLVQPEARYWLCQRFSGHFFGAHLLGGEYNFGGMLPWGIQPPSSGLGNHRYEGWIAGAGVSYGYDLVLGKRWNLEMTLGLGYARLSYDRFDCKSCGQKLGSETKNYLGPTKAGITLVYIIK